MLDVALVIGRSESGKTTLAKSLLEKQEKPVRVVNDSSGDLDPGWETCNWSDLERLEGVAVLVEDVVAATQTEFAHLQRLLSVGCHPRSVGPVYILCHR
jgi:molybdopterin-guanine dinucleotide biosynthesis protein